MSDDQIELIADDYGVAVIGDPKAVEAFLASEGLESKELDLPRLSNMISAGSAASQIGAQLAIQSGRWVKLTKNSAQKMHQYGLTPAKGGGHYAMIGKPGRTQSWLKIQSGAGTIASNPALLSGAAGVMTQLAMQQAMNEITQYLEKLDAKLDDVLRAQKDAVISMMIGVGFDVDEAMTLREHVGRVNEVTWSKVQAASSTIARTQSYALLQLDALADNLENKERISSLLDAARETEAKTQEWLGVLARCFQLQDAIAVLEIDRVLETSPDDLDGHRLGLKAARAARLDAIAQTTNRLLDRMAVAASAANQKVLFNPSQSPAVVKANANVSIALNEFHSLLEIEQGGQGLEARSWKAAAGEITERAREAGADGLEAAKRLGGEARDRARLAKGKLAGGLDRARRLRSSADEDR